MQAPVPRKPAPPAAPPGPQLADSLLVQFLRVAGELPHLVFDQRDHAVGPLRDEIVPLAIMMRGVTIDGMIVSFKGADAQALAAGRPVRRLARTAAVGRRKLRQLQIAGRLEDLAVPPGNRLERLKGDRKGQYSIRINDQFRICFRWTAAGAEDVEIVDYH